jgi:hypothetical protein
MGIGKASAPPAPDYAAAAQQTAAGNLANSRATTQANRANQYTPYGSLTWVQDANNPDSWTQSINLNDTGQKLLDASNQTSLGLAGLQGNAMGRVADMQGTPFDYGSVKDTQDAAYKGYTSRLDPMWSQASQSNDAKLANQGIVQGSEAYNNAMRTFNQGKNDAYQQAMTGAINTAPQTLQMAQALRSQPLNELNALRTGSQVQNPQFSGYANQGQTAGPDYMGAANAQYGAANDAVNAGNAMTANGWSGLMGMAGSGFGKGGAFAQGGRWGG